MYQHIDEIVYVIGAMIDVKDILLEIISLF